MSSASASATSTAGYVPFGGEGYRLDGNPVKPTAQPKAKTLDSDPTPPSPSHSHGSSVFDDHHDCRSTIATICAVVFIISAVSLLICNSLGLNGHIEAMTYSQVSLGFAAAGLASAVAGTIATPDVWMYTIVPIILMIALTTLFGLSTAEIVGHEVPAITMWAVKGVLILGVIGVSFCH